MNEAERLLAHIEKFVGATVDRFAKLDVPEARGSVGCCIFEGRPTSGVRTLVTIGLSHSHPREGSDHVELILEVGSRDDIWLLAVSEFAAQVKRLPFRAGDTFTVGEPFIPSESALSSFALVEPFSVQPGDHRIDLGPRIVAFRQLVPLFTGEFEHAKTVGGVRAVEELRHTHGVVPHDVRRRDTSSG
jgi:hypothetical protein